MLQWLKKHATPESNYYDQKISSNKIQETTRTTVLSTALPGMAVNKSVDSHTRKYSTANKPHRLHPQTYFPPNQSRK